MAKRGTANQGKAGTRGSVNTVNRGNQLNPAHTAYHRSRGASQQTAANNAQQAGGSGSGKGG